MTWAAEAAVVERGVGEEYRGSRGASWGLRESELDARLAKQVQETTLHLIVCNDVQYKMLKSKNVKIQRREAEQQG